MPRHRFARIASAAVVSLLLLRPAAASEPVAAGARPSPALGAFLAGTVAGNLGDDARAAGFMAEAQRSDPNDPRLRHTAFMFAALSGTPDAAALAAGVKPDLLSILVLANAAAQNGDWNRAATLFAALPADPLVAAIGPLLSAWAQFGAGNADAAIATLSNCRGPLAGTCLLNAGTVAELARRDAQADALYSRTESEFGLASLAALQTAGSFLVRHGRAADADAMLDALVRRVPVLGMVRGGLQASLARPAVGSAADGLARAYLGIAELLRETGGDNGKVAAGFMLRFALVMQPGLAPAHLTLAELQAAAKHPAEAAATLRDVDPADPLFPIAELRTATLDAMLGQRDAAIARLRALSDRLPDRPEPAESLGDVLSDARDWPGAIAAYDRAITDQRRLEHGHLAGDDWRLLFARAVAFDRSDRWPQARLDLEAALSLAPAEPFVLNYLGYSMVERRDDLPKARVLIQRALAAKPDDGSIRDSLGWAMLRQDDVPGAVRTLERAAEQDPEDPTVNFHLGAAYWAAGRRIEAEDQWRWALVLHPDADAEKQIRDALARAEHAGGRGPGNAPGNPAP
ncbi:MAG: tetratricopeptide repeat protein [Gluconacetobacter diazotrophicus]|nr:tetratricopeptide repeat protein [Gluconacetobacter diazotrophicus]